MCIHFTVHFVKGQQKTPDREATFTPGHMPGNGEKG